MAREVERDDPDLWVLIEFGDGDELEVREEGCRANGFTLTWEEVFSVVRQASELVLRPSPIVA